MSRKKRELSGEEKALWKRVASNVKPRRPAAAEDAPPPEDKPAAKPSPKPPKTVSQVRQGVSQSAQGVRAPAPRPPNPPADRSGEKRVRRGKLEIGGSLDLHGHTQDSGRAALFRFLYAAQARGDRTVIVVTGKGRAGEGVLKRALPGWLAAPELKPILAGYAPAHQSHGGAGAFYVFLKARRAD